MAFDLIAFLAEEFPSLSLNGGLFYRWPIGLRFELAGRAPSLPERLARAKERACKIYEAAFTVDERCVIVGQDWPGSDSPLFPDSSRLFAFANAEGAGLRDPQATANVQATDGFDACTLTWVEQPSRSLDFGKVFQGIANFDHGLRSIRSRVYLVNPRTRVILHMYDDRGLDLVAVRKQDLAAHYQAFNDWLLDYDRARMDRLFGSEEAR